MNRRLQEAFDALEQSRLKLLQEVEQLNSEQYNKEQNGKWSVAQIVTHIITSEKLALLYMKKKSLGISSLENSGFLEPVKLTLLKISQRLPIRYKAPVEIIKHTPEAMTLESANTEWKNLRIKLRAFLEGIEDSNVKKKIFKHPIAGRFNAIQGITFLREHLLHHLPQIRRHLK
jgi:hypothetical protein